MKTEDIARFETVKAELLPLATAPELDSDGIARYTELSAEFDALAAKVEEHNKFIARKSADVERAKRLTVNAAPARETEVFDRDPLGDPGDVQRVSTLRNPWDIDAIRRTDNIEELFSRATSAVEQTPGSNDARRQALTRMLEENGDERMSRLVLATTSPAYKTAFGKIARASGDLALANLNTDERKAVEYAQSIKRAVSMTTDNAGGYLVPTDIEAAVTLSSTGTDNPIYSLARRVQTTSDTYRVVTAPNAAWSWDGENTEVSDDTPTFANTDIPLYLAQGFVPFSYASQGSISGVTGIISDVLMGGWNDLVGAALTTGSGSSQPTGIVTALTGGSSEINAAGEAVALADLYSLWDALPARHRRNATWMANISIINDLRQLSDAGGFNLLVDLQAGSPTRLFGVPLVENSDLDGSINAAATANNYVIVVGNFQHYVIAEGVGTTTRFIPDVFGTTGRPIGASGVYMSAHFGADSVLDSAFRMLDVATAA
jgi:HK97 family phage major capsid protein